MPDATSLRQIAALALACGRMTDPGRDLALERLLSQLADEYPEVAKIIASVLVARGDEVGRELGEAVRERLGDYDGSPFMDEPVGLTVDYLVLSVKKVELKACLRVFGVTDAARVVELGHGLEAWTAEADGRTFAFAMVGTAGNVESALHLGALLTLVRARACVLVGMAGGVKGEVLEGDVVVAESVLAYEFQEMRREGPLYMPKPYSPPERHINRTETLDVVRPRWPDEVRQDFQRDLSKDESLSEVSPDLFRKWKPKVRRGVVLAGSKLIEDGSLPSLVTKLHGRTLAAEMEGAGFAAACSERDVPWLVIRGIADHGETPRPKYWQFAASYAAARFLRDGLRYQRIDLLM